MEGGSGVTRSIINEFHSLGIQRDQMKGEICFTDSIIDELDSSNIHGGQTEGGSGVNRSIIDDLHSWDMQGNQI